MSQRRIIVCKTLRRLDTIGTPDNELTINEIRNLIRELAYCKPPRNRGQFSNQNIEAMYLGRRKIYNLARYERNRLRAIRHKPGATARAFFELEWLINQSRFASQYFRKSLLWFTERMNYCVAATARHSPRMSTIKWPSLCATLRGGWRGTRTRLTRRRCPCGRSSRGRTGRKRVATREPLREVL